MSSSIAASSAGAARPSSSSGHPHARQGASSAAFIAAVLVVLSLVLTGLYFSVASSNKSSETRLVDCRGLLAFELASERVSRGVVASSVITDGDESKAKDLAEVQGNVDVRTRENENPVATIAKARWPVPYEFKNEALSAEDEAELRRRETEWSLDQWATEAMAVVERNAIEEPSGKYLIVTASNLGIAELTMNFIASLRINRYEKFVIMCHDSKFYRMMWEYGLRQHATMIPKAWTNFTIRAEHAEWASQDFMNVGVAKMIIIRTLTDAGYHVLSTDVDIVFLSPFVLKHIIFENEMSKPDLVFQVDNSIGNPNVISKSFNPRGHTFQTNTL